MNLRPGVAIAFSVLALSGCDRREAPEPQSATVQFSHRLTADVSGEYRPVGTIGTVASLFVGQNAAFEAWEANRAGASPVILILTGPDGAAAVTVRSYLVTDDAIRITGLAANGGPVSLTARIDRAALATARRNLGDRTAVITGTVSADGRRSPVDLGWWGGD